MFTIKWQIALFYNFNYCLSSFVPIFRDNGVKKKVACWKTVENTEDMLNISSMLLHSETLLPIYPT